MKLYLRCLFAAAIMLPMLPVGTQAHFKLLEPASWITEDQRLGDPQKLGPCGGCTAPGSLDTHLCYAAWRSSYSSRASIGV